ncbi:MAG: two-component regulator propeller domain-containing protein [Bacteroidales bacterium]|nr:two-component regulator propeller domain-containing protein [Bacteroidales bacterium]
MRLGLKIRIFSFITFLLLIVSYNNVFPQYDRMRFERISSEKIKIERGLSVNTVFCINQDKRGYIWIGTWDGLNKFDGYDFMVYKLEFAEDNELSNQTINVIYTDNSGFIWLGTNKGLSRFDNRTQKFIHYNHSKTNKNSISSDTVYSIIEDKNNNLWVGTQNGLNLFHRTENWFEHFFYDKNNINSLCNNVVRKIIVDNLGFMWLGTNRGLDKYNFLARKFTHFSRSSKTKNTLCCDSVTSLFQDKSSILWIGTQNGLCSFNINDEKFVNYLTNPHNINSISGNEISDIYEDRTSVLWIATSRNGVNIFDRGKNKFIRFVNNPDDENSLINNNVSCIFEDRTGIIWIGTYKGITKINKNSKKFAHHKYIPDANNNNSNIVWALCVDKENNLWVGTDGGLTIYNRNTKTRKILSHNPKNKNSLSSNSIRSICELNSDIFIIGTSDKGIDVYNKKTGQFRNYKNDPSDKYSISGNVIWRTCKDNDNYMWIGTDNGLNKFDEKSGKFTVYKNNPKDKYSLSNNTVYTIFQDKKGNIWVGTGNGLNRFEKQTGKFYVYKPSKNKNYINNSIASIYEDKNNIIWFGTYGGGLNKFNVTKNIFKNYSTNEGLANNTVYAILEDNQGNLWMSTNDGISKFNKGKEYFTNYSVKDGIQSHEFNGGSYCKDVSGKMFFGGMNGFNSFYPEKINSNSFVPALAITSFKIFNKIYKVDIFDKDTIKLNYYDNFFTIEFSALDFSNPDNNNYKYKLENFDNNWINCSANHRYAEYTKVAPGKYTFRVKGSNNDGIWNEEGISFTIIITPPWWQTWIFRILSALAIILLIWYIVYLRIKRIKEKNETEKRMLAIEKQLFEFERQTLRLQMNPHFIFNSLSSIQSFIINNDIDKAVLYLSKFAQLMRIILANSREAYVPVRDEIKSLSHYMDIEKIRFNNKFDYNFYVDKNIDDEFVGIPPMIIQPYVENSILHGILHKESRGYINISLTLQENLILCIVEDNGVGRQKAMQIKKESGLKRESKGMLITKERLEVLNKQSKEPVSVNITDLYDENNNPTGTKVTINLPFQEL